MNNFLLIAVGIATSALAQIMLKKSSGFQFLKEPGFFIFFIAGGLFYVASFGIYTYALKIFNLSKISPVMTIGTMLLVVIAGTLIFKEEISFKQSVGIFLGVLSIALIVR
jgi:multidrug transporter EmrE-like cation transporter